MPKRKKKKQVITGNLSADEAGFLSGVGLSDSEEIITQQGTIGQPVVPLNNQITPEMWNKFRKGASPIPATPKVDFNLVPPAPVLTPEDPLAGMCQEKKKGPVHLQSKFLPISRREISWAIGQKLPDIKVRELNEILITLGFHEEN